LSLIELYERGLYLKISLEDKVRGQESEVRRKAKDKRPKAPPPLAL
jgi:hypothetical protein